MKLKPTQPVTLKLPAFRRVSITLVGCGGTGSHLASGLAALALALRERDVRTDLLLIDADKVENKNVGRQLFTAADVGKSKSSLLAERLYAAYGLPVMASVRWIEAADTFLTADALSIVVGAVDNTPARKLIAGAVEKAGGALWWLDTGNNNRSGQIALGNSVDPKAWTPALGMVDSLPAPHVVYPDLIQAPKQAKRASCADATAAGDQGLMVNRMAAAWALAMLNDFLLGALKYFALDFDLAFGGVRALPLNAETLHIV